MTDPREIAARLTEARLARDLEIIRRIERRVKAAQYSPAPYTDCMAAIKAVRAEIEKEPQ